MPMPRCGSGARRSRGIRKAQNDLGWLLQNGWSTASPSSPSDYLGAFRGDDKQPPGSNEAVRATIERLYER